MFFSIHYSAFLKNYHLKFHSSFWGALYLGAGGIALSTSLTQGFGFVFSYSLLSRYFKSKERSSSPSNQNLLLEAGKICIACIPMAAVGFLLLAWANNTLLFFLQAIKLGIIVSVMGATFYISSKYVKSIGYNIAQGYIISGVKKLKIIKR